MKNAFYTGFRVTCCCICLLIQAATASAPLHAQQLLTLQDALNTARANNPYILQEQFEVAHSNWVIKELQAGNLPALSVSTQVSHLGEAPGAPVDFDMEQRLIQLGGRNSFRTRLELNQKILDFGRTGHNIQAVRFGQQAQRASYNRELNNLSVWVKTAYYGVLHNMRLDSMYASIVDQQKQLEEISQARFNERVLLEPALLQTRADVQFATARRAQVQGEIARGLITLARLMGVDHAHFTLTGSPPDYAGITLPADALQLFYEQALVNRAELGQLQFQVQQENARIQALKATRHPTLGLQAELTYYGPTSLFGDYSSFGGQGLKSYNWRVGLSFEVPLFDGSQTHARIEQAAIRLSQVDTRRRQVALEIRSDLEVVINDVQRLQQVQQGNALLYEASRMNLALGKTQFNNGTLPLLAFIQLAIAHANSAILLEQQAFEITSLILSLETIIGQTIVPESITLSHNNYGTFLPGFAQTGDTVR